MLLDSKVAVCSEFLVPLLRVQLVVDCLEHQPNQIERACSVHLKEEEEEEAVCLEANPSKLEVVYSVNREVCFPSQEGSLKLVYLVHNLLNLVGCSEHHQTQAVPLLEQTLEVWAKVVRVGCSVRKLLEHSLPYPGCFQALQVEGCLVGTIQAAACFLATWEPKRHSLELLEE